MAVRYSCCRDEDLKKKLAHIAGSTIKQRLKNIQVQTRYFEEQVRLQDRHLAVQVRCGLNGERRHGVQEFLGSRLTSVCHTFCRRTSVVFPTSPRLR